MRLRSLIAIALIGGAVYGVEHLQTNDGCPGGTTSLDSGLMESCDARDGSTSCVMWAQGFTPFPRDVRVDVKYEPTAVPDNGAWCPGATSPPPGDGG